MQLIASDVVTQAAKRHPVSHHYEPLILAIDVARFGTDQSVFKYRRGRDAKTIPSKKYRGVDTMALSGEAAASIDKHHPDAVFIDETGIGGAVVDRLRQLGHKVIGVNNGGASDWPVDGIGVANKGAEMWVRGREWLQTGGAIEDDPELCAELESREYGYDSNNYIKLEKKDDMKKRGLHSPDNADALMLTFAHPVRQKAPPQIGGSVVGRAISDWNPYADDR
jgi:phage terminase large subunit